MTRRLHFLASMYHQNVKFNLGLAGIWENPSEFQDIVYEPLTFTLILLSSGFLTLNKLPVPFGVRILALEGLFQLLVYPL